MGNPFDKLKSKAVKADSAPHVGSHSSFSASSAETKEADSKPSPTRQEVDEANRPKQEEPSHIVAARKIPAHGLRTRKIHDLDLPQVSAARVRGHLEPYKAPLRDERGRVVPGSSLNPHGRPIGFVEYIRAMTDDGKELIDHALLCLRGTVMVRFEDPITGEWTEKEMPADPKYQAEARVFLKESGYGKALATLEVKQAEDTGPDYTKLDVAETRDLLRLMAKAEARALPAQGSSLQRADPMDRPAITPALPQATATPKQIQGDTRTVAGVLEEVLSDAPTHQED